MKYIHVYFGSGTSRFSASYLLFTLNAALNRFGYQAVFIRPEDIRGGRLRRPDTAMLVIGGGSFTEVKKNLHREGVWEVQEYVRRGGTYLGICMGAFGAGHHIDFTGHDVRLANTGFAFFNHTARGSLPIAPSLYDGTSRSATIYEMTHLPSGIKFPALYWGGNYWPDAILRDPSATALARMVLPNGEEKLVGASIQVGDHGGKAVLCGYHIEAHKRMAIWKWLKDFAHSPDDMKRLHIELMQHPEGAYQMGLALALDDLALVQHHSFAAAIWPQRFPADALSGAPDSRQASSFLHKTIA